MNQGSRGNLQPALSVPFQQQNPRQTDKSKSFYSQTNYARLLQPLREQYERKTNTDELPEYMDNRLQKTLKHYMDEVFRINGESTSINSLNQEIYRETTLNFDTWLQKQVTTNSNSSKNRNTFQSNDNLFESVGNRFEREQQSRASVKQSSSVVDFTLPKNEDDEDNEDPLEKFERLRKIREQESKNNVPKPANKSNNENDLYSEPSAPSAVSSIPPSQQSNPPPPPLLGPRPQEYIIKQEDVVKYRENEINLFINSGDRDWLANRNENRYNFTINFNTVSSTNNNTFSPSIKERFKNIVRMELVKMIMSSEPLEISYRMVTSSSGTPTLDTSRVVNVLSHPYIMVRISEWSSNGYGTNSNIDNTFGIVQYDQAWKSDTLASNFGYVSLTPRYLKAQRVYQPTPLATLTKLSFEVEKPDGQALTKMLDTLDLQYVYLSDAFTGSNYSTVGSNYAYIFIITNSYFNRFFVSEGDRIKIRGYSPTVSQANMAAQNELNTYLNRDEGHIIVGTAVTTSSVPPFVTTDNYNSSGYANIIILRSKFNDPALTGNLTRNYFGGNQNSEQALYNQMSTQTPISGAALLNTNRQSHFVLRIITREMDAVSNLRPDNS